MKRTAAALVLAAVAVLGANVTADDGAGVTSAARSWR